MSALDLFRYQFYRSISEDSAAASMVLGRGSKPVWYTVGAARGCREHLEQNHILQKYDRWVVPWLGLPASSAVSSTCPCKAILIRILGPPPSWSDFVNFVVPKSAELIKRYAILGLISMKAPFLWRRAVGWTRRNPLTDIQTVPCFSGRGRLQANIQQNGCRWLHQDSTVPFFRVVISPYTTTKNVQALRVFFHDFLQ